jgi:glycosyltransferase involved in cell wall biosynthesis
MHICYVTIDYHQDKAGGGIASYVAAMSKALLAQGHRVTVLAPGQAYQVEIKDGLGIVKVPLGSWHWYLYKLRAPSLTVLPVRELEWSLALRRGFDRLLENTPIDLVEGGETGMLFISARQQNYPPVVMRLHGAPYTFRKYSRQAISLGEQLNHRFELLALRRASSITSPSRFQAQEIAADLDWPPERIQAIPNPIAPWILQQAPPHKPRDNQQPAPFVLYTGRIEYRKGILPLLHSVPYVAKACPEVQYAIAGGYHNSIDAPTLNRVLDQDNIRAYVQLLGHIPWTQLAEWYRRAAVFVMPSYYETFGISVIEAMAFGLPVVATRAGGLPEVVEDGVTGILVPPGNTQALAEAIICLLRSPDLRRRMGQAGRERVLAEFTVEQVTAQTLTLYQKVMQQR